MKSKAKDKMKEEKKPVKMKRGGMVKKKK